MLRLIAWLFAALALAAVGLDVFETMNAPDGFQFRAVGEYWFRIHPDSLQLLQPAIERHISTKIWDPYALIFLTLPAAAVAAGASLVFFLLSGIRRWRSRRKDPTLFGPH